MPVRDDDDNGDGAIKRKEFERRMTEIQRQLDQRMTEAVIDLTKLQGDIRSLQASIRNGETRMDERAAALTIALDKASAVLNERLEGMNQFRRQIDNERATYMTADKLELILKGIRVEIEGVRVQIKSEVDNIRSQIGPIRESQDFGAGREAAAKAAHADQKATYAIIAAIALGALDVVLRLMGH